MNDFPTRILVSVGIFVAGLHGIALGMISNGSNDPRNPVWRFLTAVFAVEVFVLKFVLCVVALIFLIWAVIHLVSLKKSIQGNDVRLKDSIQNECRSDPRPPIEVNQSQARPPEVHDQPKDIPAPDQSRPAPQSKLHEADPLSAEELKK